MHTAKVNGRPCKTHKEVRHDSRRPQEEACRSSRSVSSQTDEQRLAAVLQRCDGVGNVTALLSDTGAVIVCDGADDAAVRLSVIKAVEAFTGFSSDSIQVIKTAPNIRTGIKDKFRPHRQRSACLSCGLQ